MSARPSDALDQGASDPTAGITLDFPGYVAAREAARLEHLPDGVPDYGFALDRALRRRILGLAPVRFLMRALVRHIEPVMQQHLLMSTVLVGPRQVPEIHAIAVHCAHTLGIGVPRVFLQQDPRPNAWTCAADDLTPSVVVTTGLVDAVDRNELTAVIGHECGHIHNLHGACNTLVEFVANPLVAGMLRRLQISGLIQVSLLGPVLATLGSAPMMFLRHWSRYAEITADRAGAICAGGTDPMAAALVKIMTGGARGLEEVNADGLVEQMEAVRGSPLRLQELWQSHPLTAKRIAALRLFERCILLDGWLPPKGGEAPRPVSLAETDTGCEALLRIVKRPAVLAELSA
jgi:Zn-dependent protease with chaperone function